MGRKMSIHSAVLLGLWSSRGGSQRADSPTRKPRKHVDWEEVLPPVGLLTRTSLIYLSAHTKDFQCLVSGVWHMTTINFSMSLRSNSCLRYGSLPSHSACFFTPLLSWSPDKDNTCTSSCLSHVRALLLDPSPGSRCFVKTPFSCCRLIPSL